MTSKQIWNHEVTYHPEDIQDRSKCHSLDYRIYLADTIKKLGLGEGDYVTMEKPEDANYIVGSKLTEEDDETPDSDKVYKIFTDGSTRLRVTLKTKWIDEFIEFDGEDILVLEVNEIEDEFRIYRNDDYDKRKQELKDQGIFPRLGKSLALIAATFYEKTESLREGFGDDIDDEGPVPVSDGKSDEWNTEKATNNDNASPPTRP